MRSFLKAHVSVTSEHPSYHELNMTQDIHRQNPWSRQDSVESEALLSVSSKGRNKTCKNNALKVIKIVTKSFAIIGNPRAINNYN